MKSKHLFLAVLMLLIVQNTFGQTTLSLVDGKETSETFNDKPLRDVKLLDDGLIVTYKIKHAYKQPADNKPETFLMTINAFGQNTVPGEPSVPVRVDFIAVPYGCKAVIEQVDYRYKDFDMELTPARQLAMEGEPNKTEDKVEPIKDYEGFFPETCASIDSEEDYQGVGIYGIRINPVLYNQKTKTTRAYSQISYKVKFVKKTKEEIAESDYDEDELDPNDTFLRNVTLNGDQILQQHQQPQTRAVIYTTDKTKNDYIIVTTNALYGAAGEFAAWKNFLGHKTRVIKKDSWTHTEVYDSIKRVARTSSNYRYLLIIGDQDMVPGYPRNGHVTDYYYGCTKTASPFTQATPNLYRGRIPASTNEEATKLLTKIAHYEMTPPTFTGYYNNAMHCAFFQDDNSDTDEDLRFILTSEEIKDTMETYHGKTITRVYSTNCQDDSGPGGWIHDYYHTYTGDLPSDIGQDSGFAWDGNANDINDRIHAGCLYILYRGHGSELGWTNPSYHNSDLEGFHNMQNTPLVFSMTCKTGKFDYSGGDCFAEKFLKVENGGCIGIYAATDVNYSGFDDILTEAMFDAIWPNPGILNYMPLFPNAGTPTAAPTPTYELGQILEQGVFRMKELCTNNAERSHTAEVNMLFGDPGMMFHTQVPTSFGTTIVQRDQPGHLYISVNGGPARITAYNISNGEIFTIYGSSVNYYTDNPEFYTVTFSAPNKFFRADISPSLHYPRPPLPYLIKKNNGEDYDYDTCIEIQDNAAESPVYNLHGIKVNNMQKGHIYIVNGKKVFSH